MVVVVAASFSPCQYSSPLSPLLSAVVVVPYFKITVEGVSPNFIVHLVSPLVCDASADDDVGLAVESLLLLLMMIVLILILFVALDGRDKMLSVFSFDNDCSNGFGSDL